MPTPIQASLSPIVPSPVHKRPWKQPKPIQTLVQPIPPALARLGEKPSTSRAALIAYAPRSLMTQLSKFTQANNGPNTSTRVPVAVTWSRERRLCQHGVKGKGKNVEESLIIWVETLPEEAASLSQDQECIYIPASLLPAFSTPPLSVRVQHHDPIQLESIVVQLVAEGRLEDVQPSEVDLEEVQRYLVAGSDNREILREGDTISLHLGNANEGNVLLRALMLEPVQQGIPTRSTRIILSPTPYAAPPDEDDFMDDTMSSHSHSRTHISLHDFDPDAFLSGSLSLQARISSDDDLVNGHTEDSWQVNGYGNGSGNINGNGNGYDQGTETSGSTTPRAFRPASPAVPVEEVLLDDAEEPDSGTRFTAIPSSGPASSGTSEDVDACWVGVGGLGRAGIFEGDWVLLRPTTAISLSAGISGNDCSRSNNNPGRLVKVLAWEQLDEPIDSIPVNTILVPPTILRAFGGEGDQVEVFLTPTPFGARTPTLPVAKSVTVARVATAEGVDKRYERAWLRGLKRVFNTSSGQASVSGTGRLVRRGDIFGVPVYRDRAVTEDDDLSDDDDDEVSDPLVSNKVSGKRKYDGLVYFIITALSFEPLIPIEDDFRSSASSKARAGELGCWVDLGRGINGGGGETRMVLTGLERARIGHREWDKGWCGIEPIPRPAFSIANKLRDLLSSALSPAFASAVQLSVLVKGARGAGKRTVVRSLADELGYNVIEVDCYDITGDTLQVTQGMLQARLEKAKNASPVIVLLHHIEALAKKSESSATGRQPPMVKVLEDALGHLRTASRETEWSCVLLGTTCDADSVPGELLGCFKQDVEINAPNESERGAMIDAISASYCIAPDVSLSGLATQTAALHANDIRSLLHRSHDLAVKRATTVSGRSVSQITLAGLAITSADLSTALSDARSAYSDSIGAPKIPNVSWDDIGGLASVKTEILETIQLPLEHPELFADGVKKRSGILLYGPPGTGKTLLAKAVATSCSLNFFSVKGPELLNMYIGESEANVRRIFQRARDASPCVIFMDELDSVAPKRGNQGDSGGVMDRIVSQLLAELDGIGGGGGGGGDVGVPPQVYVMGATNRPDLLDPALLRPGRFDRLVYLSPPKTHKEQTDILRALTRKFDLHEELDLGDVAERCGFNLTGADLYALASDAMLGAMGRVAGEVDARIEALERLRMGVEVDVEVGQEARKEGKRSKGSKVGGGLVNGYHVNDEEQDDLITPGDIRDGAQEEEESHRVKVNGIQAEGDKGESIDLSHYAIPPSDWPSPLTPQFYLSALATEAEMRVRVGMDDFTAALDRLRPSVSEGEMRHYEQVQKGFKSGGGSGGGT